MKNLIKGIIAVSVLFITANTQAQMQRRTPEERAQGQVEWMQKNLGINDNQAKQAHDIILKYAEQAQNAMSDPNADRRQIMEDTRAKRDDELKGVLTADQFKKYQEHTQEMMNRMRGGGMRNGGGQPGGN